MARCASDIEDTPAGRKRIIVDYVFRRGRSIELSGNMFNWSVNDSLRLFFSYRYQPAQIEAMLREHGLECADRWVTDSGEEGVFLCRCHS